MLRTTVNLVVTAGDVDVSSMTVMPDMTEVDVAEGERSIFSQVSGQRSVEVFQDPGCLHETSP